MLAEKEVSVAPLPVSWRSSAPNVWFGNLDRVSNGRTAVGVSSAWTSTSANSKPSAIVAYRILASSASRPVVVCRPCTALFEAWSSTLREIWLCGRTSSASAVECNAFTVCQIEFLNWVVFRFRLPVASCVEFMVWCCLKTETGPPTLRRGAALR